MYKKGASLVLLGDSSDKSVQPALLSTGPLVVHTSYLRVNLTPFVGQTRDGQGLSTLWSAMCSYRPSIHSVSSTS